MAEPNVKKVKRCVEMFTDEVSVVNRGANGHKKFLMVKADEGGDVGTIAEEDVEKAVPSKDATREAKEKAQAARSKKYGIEILSKGSALSYPAKAPTTESLYGDPVNLKYPLAYEGATKPDPARTRNAVARFKQNYTTYSEKSSQARIYERIVRAALRVGIDVSYDPADPVDQLLPSDLKTRLQKDDAEGDQADPSSTESDSAEEHGDSSVSEWLDGVRKSVEGSDDKDWFADALAALESVDGSQEPEGVKKEDGGAPEDEPQAAPEPEPEPEPPAPEPVAKKGDAETTQALEELKKESEAKDSEIADLKKSVTALKAQLSRLNNTIGSSNSIRPGANVTYNGDDEDPYADRNASIDLGPALS